MAEPDQLKKETVRIELPVRETGNPPIPFSPPSGAASAEEISSTNFPQAPNTPTAPLPLSTSVSPRSVSAALGLKEETVRISPMPDASRSSQKKTEPLIAMPHVGPQNPPMPVAPAEKSSMLPYWVLLGFSAVILIIQIWIYLS